MNVVRYKLGGEQVTMDSNRKISVGKKKYESVASVKEDPSMEGVVGFQILDKNGNIVREDKHNLILNAARGRLARMLTGEILSGFKITKLHVGDMGTDPTDHRVPLPVDRNAIALIRKRAEYDVENASISATNSNMATFEFYIPFEDLNGLDLNEFLLEATMNDSGTMFPFSIGNRAAIPKDSSIAVRIFWSIRF